jgi:hypothetical protein
LALETTAGYEIINLNDAIEEANECSCFDVLLLELMTFSFCISSATSNNIDEKELAYVCGNKFCFFFFYL